MDDLQAHVGVQSAELPHYQSRGTPHPVRTGTILPLEILVVVVIVIIPFHLVAHILYRAYWTVGYHLSDVLPVLLVGENDGFELFGKMLQ